MVEGAKKEEGFKPKAANPNLFPAKKRLVKKMMFDYIVEKLSLLFSDQNGDSCFKRFSTLKTSKPKKKSKQIHPHTNAK
ncbi:hypothetical protein TorRG33x02_271070 [Trema orientale]|uniref:Uncharacterized protein n=1 Tax=Trema orientale TaxID=63057 RepID=A0A2P5CWF1_TREOI|nr:hypothetical protein TorRG33x02_271070 [Trema orientale]